jgi:hypothetical protein
MENQNVSLLYRNRIYGFRNDASRMLSGYIQEYLKFYLGVFGIPGFLSLLIFQPIL